MQQSSAQSPNITCEYVRPDLKDLAHAVGREAPVTEIAEQFKKPDSIDNLNAHAWIVANQLVGFMHLIAEMFGEQSIARMGYYTKVYRCAMYDMESRENCIIRGWHSSWNVLPGSEMKSRIPGVCKGALFFVPIPSCTASVALASSSRSSCSRRARRVC